MDTYVPPEVTEAVQATQPPQRLEIETYALIVENYIEHLRAAMEVATRFRNRLRDVDKPLDREELEDQIDLFERMRKLVR